MNLADTINELKKTGIKFDDKNVRECLKKEENRHYLSKSIKIAKELNLDLEKDSTKTGIVIIANNFNRISDCKKEAMSGLINNQCDLTMHTIKNSNMFLELLYVLGEAVDRQHY